MQLAPLATMISFRLEVPTIRAFETCADAFGVSRSGLMRTVLTDWIHRHTEPAPNAQSFQPQKGE